MIPDALAGRIRDAGCEAPGVAVFDADGTLWREDVGEGTEFILRFPSASALDTAGRLGMVQIPLSVESVVASPKKVPA